MQGSFAVFTLGQAVSLEYFLAMSTFPTLKKNISESERIVSAVGGAAMVALGLSKRGILGWFSATLGSALLFRGVSGNCQLYEALDISTAGPDDYSRISVPGNRGIKIEQSFFVQRSPEELFRTWRNFENLPHFMKHLESVRVLDEKRSHWVARGLGGRKISWNAEVINE